MLNWDIEKYKKAMRKEAREEARIEAREEARKEEMLNIAKRCLSMGLSIEDTAKGTDLEYSIVYKLAYNGD